MSDTTEVYVCYEGQALKEGKLEYSYDIHDKEAAQSDAERRCQRDPTIHRIAYYAVDASGRFRNFCTYSNPNPAPAGSRGGGRAGSRDRGSGAGAGSGGTVAAKTRGTQKPEKKLSLKERLVNFFMEEE